MNSQGFFFSDQNNPKLISFLYCVLFRRQYTKRQRIIHMYGQTADEELNEEATRAVEENLQMQQTQAATKACVCGGTDHLRRSSVRCALNKKNQ